MSVAAASAQPLPDAIPNPSWGPAGTVSAVACQGDTLYVGGRFRDLQIDRDISRSPD
jgi:hypothetical protein